MMLLVWWAGFASCDLMEGLDRHEVHAKRRDVDPLMATATKHYVRKYVWLPVATERANKLGHPVHYFTLTTADLFDVKVLEREGLLERTTRGYPGLGFCEYDDKTYDDIVRSLRWCGWSHKGWFEEMVRSHPAFEADFCFDVINLDFILVPFPDQESPLDGTWGAIRRVLEVQWNHRRSFDLFLTFRGSRTDTSAEALKSVAGLLRTNIQAGRGTAELEARIGHCDVSRLLQEDYVEFLCIGLPKLVIGYALPLGFELSRADMYKYPRGGDKEAYHIVKFVFSFEVPPSSQPRFGDPPPLVANYDSAVPLIFRKQPKDVAGVLEADPSLARELEEDIACL